MLHWVPNSAHHIVVQTRFLYGLSSWNSRWSQAIWFKSYGTEYNNRYGLLLTVKDRTDASMAMLIWHKSLILLTDEYSDHFMKDNFDFSLFFFYLLVILISHFSRQLDPRYSVVSRSLRFFFTCAALRCMLLQHIEKYVTTTKAEKNV